jgi:GTP-binding protein LepA
MSSQPLQKQGIGIQEILTAIRTHVPAPKGSPDEPLQALIFDSVYNPFRGVETYFRVLNGASKKVKRFNLSLPKNRIMQMKLERSNSNNSPKNKSWQVMLDILSLA